MPTRYLDYSPSDKDSELIIRFARLQTVKKQDNERYYDLIFKFYQLTSVPVILNTSFNENEPIVRNPQEAIDCFLRTNMDVLVLEDWIIRRS